MSRDAVRAEGLTKTFGDHPALVDVDLAVQAGEVFGVLGPNGAGKTTAVRILTTLLAPTSGRAEVVGRDVVREPDRVRAAIGVTGQGTSVAEMLTGRENLVLFARLRGIDRRAARRRADELLDQFDLADAGGRRVATYSGGMRRRLDVAVSLLGDPAVLFLDEPTTGLDPRSRAGLWEAIERLSASGMTVVLTTQYLEEADRLADRIAIIDRGRIVAEDTPAGLKKSIGGTSLQIVAADPADPTDPAGIDELAAQVAAIVHADLAIDRTAGAVRVPITPGSRIAADVIRHLSETGTDVADVSVRQPSLDDVFFALTGHPPTPDGPATAEAPASPDAARASAARTQPEETRR
jgi:daunorubicin resistance ABC transporter ATP-binding subunit